jgi:hypothetical protein
MASRPDRQPGPVDAMMVDLVCLPEGGMVKVPAHLVDEQATLPLSGTHCVARGRQLRRARCGYRHHLSNNTEWPKLARAHR